MDLLSGYFCPYPPNTLCTEYSRICGTQENDKWRTEEPKKMGFQIRILERALSTSVQKVITFIQDLDALLPKVLEHRILGWRNRTSLLDLVVDKQGK